MRIPDKIAKVAKAVTGAVAAIGVVGAELGKALEDGTITTQEGTTLIGYVVAAGVAVAAIWAIPNRKTEQTNG